MITEVAGDCADWPGRIAAENGPTDKKNVSPGGKKKRERGTYKKSHSSSVAAAAAVSPLAFPAQMLATNVQSSQSYEH